MSGPGGTFTQAVTITNDEKSPARIHATVEDFYLSKDGTPQFRPADATIPFSAASWMRLNPVEQVLQPGASGVVRFTITAPAGTPPGGYHGAIVFAVTPPGTEGVVSKGVMFTTRVATIVYITVGSPKPAVDLVDVQGVEQRGKPPAVLATLKNTGSVHVRTKGTLTIYDKSGTVLRRIAVPDVPVLPQTERDVAIPTAEDGQAPLPAGDYKVEVRIDIGLPELLVGQTTVTIGR